MDESPTAWAIKAQAFRDAAEMFGLFDAEDDNELVREWLRDVADQIEAEKG